MSTPAQLRARSLASIQRNGAAFALRRGTGTYNPNKSEVGAGSQTWSGWAADWQFDGSSRAAENGELIDAKDVRLLVAAEGLTDPKPGDRATYASVEYRVVSAIPTRKAGVAIVYDVHLARD